MGTIEQEFQRCVAEGKIRAFGDGPRLVAKQLDTAASDLAEAKDGLGRNRWKWSTIQAYSSMFHTARALLFAKGFREKHHRCLRIAISHLYAAEDERRNSWPRQRRSSEGRFPDEPKNKGRLLGRPL